MRDFKFSPPPGVVYVAYSDKRETVTGGIITINTRPGDYVEGTVEKSAAPEVSPGDRVMFERARAFQVAEGVFSVSIDNVAIVINPEGGLEVL